MSESESGSDGGPGRREVAYRLFAAEFDDADFEYSESDEERAPNYVVTPSGARVNRLFVVGVLTEVEPVSDGVLRARVVDPTGAFVCYAGQYQPDERAFLERAEPPTFVAMTGKARTFQPDDADVIYTSVRPEAINEVDASTRDRWNLAAAEATVDRVRTAAGALALDQRGDALEAVLAANDVDQSLASGIPLAIEHYGTTAGYLASLADVALDAARLVAGEIDEVGARTLAPDATVERDLPVAPRRFEVPESMADLATEEPEAETGPTTESASAATGAESTAVADSTGSARSDSEAGESVDADEDVPDEEPTLEATPEGESTGQDDSAGGVESTPGEATGSTSTTGDPDTATAETGDAPAGTEADVGDFEPGEYDLDEEEREEIEAEYGTEFQSGTEVDEPGEADIETPDPDDAAEGAAAESAPGAPESAAAEAATSESAERTTTDDGAAGEADSGATPADETTDAAEGGAPEADLEDVAVEVMGDLDEGSGAARGAVVEATVDRTGADEAAVEDAIQQALMDGRCYEPDDDTLQAI